MRFVRQSAAEVKFGSFGCLRDTLPCSQKFMQWIDAALSVNMGKELKVCSHCVHKLKTFAKAVTPVTSKPHRLHAGYLTIVLCKQISTTAKLLTRKNKREKDEPGTSDDFRYYARIVGAHLKGKEVTSIRGVQISSSLWCLCPKNPRKRRILFIYKILKEDKA
jgi:hypothetical protein